MQVAIDRRSLLVLTSPSSLVVVTTLPRPIRNGKNFHVLSPRIEEEDEETGESKDTEIEKIEKEELEIQKEELLEVENFEKKELEIQKDSEDKLKKS